MKSRTSPENSRISIVTATYNAATGLAALISSLRLQTDQNFVWIVADGGSTDRTLDILRDLTDIDIEVTSQPDFGIYDALNRAINRTTSDYYLVVGADDELSPNAIESYRRVSSQTKADIVAFDIISGGMRITPRGGTLTRNKQFSFVAGHSVATLIRTKLHETVGMYDKRYPIAADQLFLEKAYLNGATVAHQACIAGTFGSSGLSSTDILGSLTESLRIHCELMGRFPIHFLVFLLRILHNSSKIRRQFGWSPVNEPPEPNKLSDAESHTNLPRADNFPDV